MMKESKEMGTLGWKLALVRLACTFFVPPLAGRLAQFKGGLKKIKMSWAIERSARKAVELDPAYFEPYILLGVYYRQVANLNVFIGAFARAFMNHVPKGTYEDSVNALRTAVRLNPRSLRAHYVMGRTYHKMGKNAEAAKMFRKAITLKAADHQDWLYRIKARASIKKLYSAARHEAAAMQTRAGAAKVAGANTITGRVSP